MVWIPDSKARDTHTYQLNLRTLRILQETPRSGFSDMGEVTLNRYTARVRSSQGGDRQQTDAPPFLGHGISALRPRPGQPPKKTAGPPSLESFRADSVR
jgi:hypothetical protein